MKLKSCLLALVAILGVGCGRQSDVALVETILPEHAPKVAMLPLLCTSKSEPIEGVEWNYARELTEEIRHRLHDAPRLDLVRDVGTIVSTRQLNRPDLRAIQELSLGDLAPAEFVVVSELLDHTAHSSYLSVALRLRVIDLRPEQPKVILQELIEQDYPLFAGDKSVDYTKCGWGTEAFWKTPLGLVHNKLIREVSARIESYVVTSLE